MYQIKIYDNFHYMDEEASRLLPREFESAEDALAAARRITDGSIEDARDNAEAPAAILAHYRQFGEDPIIIGEPSIEWSAWDYAHLRIMGRQA